jgi:imidazolonepropionase-like amidohydrolase
VIDSGVVPVQGNEIVGVGQASEPPPPGFQGVTLDTGGTIYPGLIDLHNHPSYNVLPMWSISHRASGPTGPSGGARTSLAELKVARLVSETLDGVFGPQELVAMATINAARILKWDRPLGSIEVGKRADLLVVSCPSECD